MVKQYAKFKVSSFSRSKDISGGVKFKNGSRVPYYAPFVNDFHRQAETCYMAKLYTNYSDMKSGTKCRN